MIHWQDLKTEATWVEEVRDGAMSPSALMRKRITHRRDSVCLYIDRHLVVWDDSDLSLRRRLGTLEKDGLHVVIERYQRSLDPYMRLGRRLRARGMGRAEVMDARYEALQAGTIEMPARAALFSISADAGPEDLEGARRLAVVYVPGATTEEIGLPGRPDGDSPWLMLPGTPWAHIMIGR